MPSPGKWIVGRQMFTGLNDPRRLDIVEAAGQIIALGSNPVSVTLAPPSRRKASMSPGPSWSTVRSWR